MSAFLETFATITKLVDCVHVMLWERCVFRIAQPLDTEAFKEPIWICQELVEFAEAEYNENSASSETRRGAVSCPPEVLTLYTAARPLE
jgi:hypothetical protein